MFESAPNYKRVLLRDVAEPTDGSFVDGPFGSNLKSHEYVQSGVRLIQLQNIGDGYWKDDNKRYITDLKFRSLARHGAVPGDIAIAKMADPVARACVVPGAQEQYVVVADCIRLRVDEARFDPRYIVRAINSHGTRTEAERKSIGSTRIRINLGTLKTVGCLVPALDQQQGVADVLDTLDSTIRQTETIIEKLKQVKQGLLYDLLTRGIDANGELRLPQSQAPHLYKQSVLGWIPTAWKASSIDEACSNVVDCPHSTPAFLDKGVLVARTMHIKAGIFLERFASRVSEGEYEERIARLRPEPGDVVFTREAPVGESFVIPEGMRICLGQRVMLLRPLPDKARGAFLAAQIYSGAIADRIAALTAGTTNPHLNVAEVRQFVMPLPPVSEQTAIERRLSSWDGRIKAEVDERDKLLLMKSGLMDDLLTGRVRVTSLLD